MAPSIVISLDELVDVLSKHKGGQIALDVYVELLPHTLKDASTEQAKHPGTEPTFGLANALRDYITPATDYRWRCGPFTYYDHPV